jgi:hypothetical protein
MDSILQSLLSSKDPAERQRLFTELIDVWTAPLIRQVLRQKLGLYVTARGESRHPVGTELYRRIRLELAEAVRSVAADPSRATIKDYRHFVLNAAKEACRRHLEDQSHPSAHLRRNLRSLLERTPKFTLWREDGALLCGFAGWEGRRISIASSSRLEKLKENPDLFKPAKGGRNELLEMPIEKLIGELLHSLGDPIEFDDLVGLITVYRRIPEMALEPGSHAQSALDEPEPAASLETVEKAQKFWREMKKLPPPWRLTLCLSPVGKNREDVWDQLLASETLTLSELAEGLELPLEQVLRLWLEAPMDRHTLAGHLDVTPLQVAAWRLQAITKIAESFA